MHASHDRAVLGAALVAVAAGVQRVLVLDWDIREWGQSGDQLGDSLNSACISLFCQALTSTKACILLHASSRIL